MLSIVKEINRWELKDELWSGGLETLKTIIQEDKLQDLMCLLEDMYPEPVSITTINDLLWFDDEFIFERIKYRAFYPKRAINKDMQGALGFSGRLLYQKWTMHRYGPGPEQVFLWLYTSLRFCLLNMLLCVIMET